MVELMEEFVGSWRGKLHVGAVSTKHRFLLAFFFFFQLN